jgi:hypothetical protein
MVGPSYPMGQKSQELHSEEVYSMVLAAAPAVVAVEVMLVWEVLELAPCIRSIYLES